MPTEAGRDLDIRADSPAVRNKARRSLWIIAVTLSFASLAVDQIWRTSASPWQELTLSNIQHEIGFAYTAKTGRSDLDSREKAQLLENGRHLGPSKQQHADIRALGNGRYSFWGEYVYLSSSDNTDPRSNGRRYSARMPAVIPLAARALYLLTSVVLCAAVLSRPKIGYVVIVLGYIIVRCLIFMGAHYTEFSDSSTFLDKAAGKLLDLDFYIGSGRFFVVPLIYKSVNSFAGSGTVSLTLFQLLLSMVAWISLAGVCSARCSLRLTALCVFAAILGFSLSTDILLWDRVILSESISTSLFVLLLTFWIRLDDGVTIRRIVALVTVSVCWGFAREANSLLLVPFALTMLCWSLLYRRDRQPERRLSLALVGTWLAIVATTSLVSARGDRWFFPLLNVVGVRVLTSPERLTYYEARGMPVNNRLLAMKGEYAQGQDAAFYKSPDLERFRLWLKARGRQVFAEDLRSHPIRTVVEPVADVQLFVCPDFTIYRPVGLQEFLPELGQSIICSTRASLAVVVSSLLTGVVLFVTCVTLRSRLPPGQALRILIAAGLLLGWVPFVWLVWHAIGGMEIGRHVFAGTMAMRMAIVILIIEITIFSESLLYKSYERP
jgi:hypothetical protein